MDPAVKTPTVRTVSMRGLACSCGNQSTKPFAGATMMTGLCKLVAQLGRKTHARSRPRGIILSVYPSVCVILQSACRKGSYVRQVMATLNPSSSHHHPPFCYHPQATGNQPFSCELVDVPNCSIPITAPSCTHAHARTASAYMCPRIQRYTHTCIHHIHVHTYAVLLLQVRLQPCSENCSVGKRGLGLQSHEKPGRVSGPITLAYITYL